MSKTQLPFCCYPCKRKFESKDLLQEHRRKSKLHKTCLAESRKQKEEVRQIMTRRIGTPSDPSFEELQQKYGQAQEELESDICQEVIQYLTKVGDLRIMAGVSTWQGNKDVQEDRYIIDMQLTSADEQHIVGFAVLDGHSGSRCVDHVVESLPRNLQLLLSKLRLTEQHLKDAVLQACESVDEEFKSRAIKDGRGKVLTDGTTMILSLFFRDGGDNIQSPAGLSGAEGYKLLTANLGDSRAVLCSLVNGKVVSNRLSRDHKPDREDEKRRIEQHGGVVAIDSVWRVHTPNPMTINGRYFTWGLAVSRAFGDMQMKEAKQFGCRGVSGPLVIGTPEIDCIDIDLEQDRFLVLACDGIWDVLSDDEALAACVGADDIDMASHAIVRRSFENLSDDNLTALVVGFKLEAGQSEEAQEEFVQEQTASSCEESTPAPTMTIAKKKNSSRKNQRVKV